MSPREIAFAWSVAAILGVSVLALSEAEAGEDVPPVPPGDTLYKYNGVFYSVGRIKDVPDPGAWNWGWSVYKRVGEGQGFQGSHWLPSIGTAPDRETAIQNSQNVIDGGKPYTGGRT